MFKENEVVMLILGVGVLLFAFFNRSQVKKITFWKLLIAGYCVLLLGWFSTVLEAFFMEQVLNLIEHISYTLSAVLFIIWCWKASCHAKEEDLA